MAQLETGGLLKRTLGSLLGLSAMVAIAGAWAHFPASDQDVLQGT